MAKRMMADVLWEAANSELWDGNSDWWTFDLSIYSCDAVLITAHYEERALAFLERLGCQTGSCMLFVGFEEGAERQGVRHMWLLLAMHVAEDEGLTC